MENDFNITIKGFNSDDSARKLGEITLNIIRQLESVYDLNTRNLKKVIISFDFLDALQEISNEFNHQSLPTFTDSKQATAIAQLLSRIGGDGVVTEYALVLSASFFMEMFADDGSISLDNIGAVIHRVHHELVHVHENNINTLDVGKLIDDYDNAFLMTAKRSWSEYLANYMSSQTAPDYSIENTLLTFERVLNEVPIEIEELVFKYKVGLLPLAEMHYAVTERIKLMSNMYGYAYGYIDGVGIDVEIYSTELFELLSESVIAIPLKTLGESFLSIKRTFDEQGICNYDVFEPSVKAVHALYASFGLHIERSTDPDMGLYIRVV